MDGYYTSKDCKQNKTNVGKIQAVGLAISQNDYRISKCNETRQMFNGFMQKLTPNS